jgi:tRNA(Ile)-lysidine synthetase-like protein
MAAMMPDPEHAFSRAVLETIERYALLPRDPAPGHRRETVIVGVSGGPDSVALLHVLHRFASERQLAIAPVVAHLHHGLRDSTADEDQVFVENLAERLGLPSEIGRADTRAEAETAAIGIEEAARNARRRFLIAAARRHKAKKVALAHHGGDRVETVLFHILRGTGVEGLATLGARAPLAPQEGIEIVRPMMHADLDRDRVEAYLRHVGQDWREDETNDDTAYTRNRLRGEILPLLGRTINPAVKAAILRLADQAETASDVLGDVLDDVWRRIVRQAPASEGESAAARDAREQKLAARQPTACESDAGASGHVPHPGPAALVIDADDFEALRPWLQGAVIRRAVERLGGGLKHMSADRTRTVVAALLAKTVAGPVALPGGLVAERRRRAIRIGPAPDAGAP